MPLPPRRPGDVLTFRELLRLRSELDLTGRTHQFSSRIRAERAEAIDALRLRRVMSPAGREVEVVGHRGEQMRMLMFGSNDYLGLATHPRVKARVREAVEAYGVGAGGPPLFNGHGPLHRELEARLAAFEGMEDALLFTSGYSANVGLMSTLPGPKDLVLYDVESHASTLDGLRMGKVEARPFPHNDARALDAMLTQARGDYRDVFVSVEGVYSMSGDICRLDQIGEVCRRHGARLTIDEAHGTGVTGPNGHGTVSMFDAADDVTSVMGTFSKTFGVSGGFIASDRDIVEYLRNCARSYIFSTSPATTICAAVLAGLDVIEQEPELHGRLMDVCGYLAAGLQERGIPANGLTAVFPMFVPPRTDMRAAAHDFHRRGLFVNHAEAPAVPVAKQQFRVSLTADHTREDVDRLLEGIDAVWAVHVLPLSDGGTLPVREKSVR